MGRYDEEIELKEILLSEFINLFISKTPNVLPLLDPTNPFYHENIKYTNTRLLMKNDYNEDNVTEHRISKNIVIKQKPITRGKKKLINPINFIEDNNLLPESLVISLNRLIRMYFLASRSTLTDSRVEKYLQAVMEDLIKLILFDLGFSKAEIRIIQNGELLMLHVSRKTPDLETFEDALLDISAYIQAQTQASPHIFESPAFSSKFVGSLRGILSVYSIIVEEFQNVINEETKSYTNFLTTMDNSTKIVSYVLFPSASYNAKIKLTTIRLDISSFFNLEFGIPYVVHEIGHGYFYAESLDYSCQMTCENYFTDFFLNANHTLNSAIVDLFSSHFFNAIDYLNKLISPKIYKIIKDGRFDLSHLQNQNDAIANIASTVFEDTFIKEEDAFDEIVNHIFKYFDISEDEISKVNSQGNVLQLYEYLSAFRLNELTEENVSWFKEYLKQFVFSNCQLFSTFFLHAMQYVSETCADYLMIKTLRIGKEEYTNLVNDNLNKQCINREGKNITELEARKDFLFNSDYQKIQLTNFHSQDAWVYSLIKLGAITALDEKCEKIVSAMQNSMVGATLGKFNSYFPRERSFSSCMAFIDAVLHR